MLWLHEQSRDAGPVVSLLAFVAYFACVAAVAVAVTGAVAGLTYGAWLLVAA